MDCLTSENMVNYFENLEVCLNEHNLMNCRGQIYNMDKTGIPLDHRQSKIVGQKQKK